MCPHRKKNPDVAVVQSVVWFAYQLSIREPEMFKCGPEMFYELFFESRLKILGDFHIPCKFSSLYFYSCAVGLRSRDRYTPSWYVRLLIRRSLPRL